ncbi:MAG TPA: fucose isomerase, partial [Spirochaetia bacterium]
MTTLGVLVGSRGIFPSDLCERGRKTVLTVLKDEDIGAVALTLKDTANGSVESRADAAKCAELFRVNRDRIDGILVTLPNFGDERGIADTLRMADLDVPVLVHAFPDEQGRMGIEQRRDGFCGKISLCSALTQYAIPYSLTSRHAMDPEEDGFREDLRRFAAVCRVTRALRHARFGQIGTRPSSSVAVRYSEKLLERVGISVETVDLSEVFGRATALRDKDSMVLSKLDEIADYVKTTKIPRESLHRMARLAVVLDQYMEERGLVGTAIQCWTSMEENFGVAPCVVMSMLSSALRPSACETDIAGLVGMYAMVLASGRPSAVASWNNN